MENRQYYLDYIVNHIILQEETERAVKSALSAKKLSIGDIAELFTIYEEAKRIAHDEFIIGKDTYEIKSMLMNIGWSSSSATSIIQTFAKRKTKPIYSYIIGGGLLIIIGICLFFAIGTQTGTLYYGALLFIVLIGGGIISIGTKGVEIE